MDNVDYYMTADLVAETHPNDVLSIKYKSLSGDKYTDTPERLGAAKALINKHTKTKGKS